MWSFALLNKYLGQQIKDNVMDRACGLYVGDEKGIHCFSGETAANWHFGKPRRRWEDNIKTDCKEICWEGVDRIDLLHEMKCVLGLGQVAALMNAVMNLRVL